MKAERKKTKQNNQKQQDSKTVDDLGMEKDHGLDDLSLTLSEPRGTCSFKGNRRLWKVWVAYSKANYGSVCHILEPIILALLQIKVIESATLKNKAKPIVIQNLHIQRVVQRHRRIKHEYVVEKEENFYDSRLGVWEYVPDAVLNDNGHAAGCGCKGCRVDARKVVRNG